MLRLLSAGLTNAEIGTALFISPKTASVHVTHALRKLGAVNRTEAATWATRHGYTADGEGPHNPRHDVDGPLPAVGHEIPGTTIVLVARDRGRAGNPAPS